MGRNKSKDDKYFNCQQEHEDHYVANLYDDPKAVSNLLEKKCSNNEIKNSTHKEVYELIKNELGFPVPN